MIKTLYSLENNMWQKYHGYLPGIWHFLSTVNFNTFQISKAFPFTVNKIVKKNPSKTNFLFIKTLIYDTCTSAMTDVGNHNKFSSCTLRVKTMLMCYKSPFQNFTDDGVTSHTVLYGIQMKILLSIKQNINLLMPTGYVTHQQFNIQQLYALPILYLCVLYLSENRQWLVPLTK
jgi:hypothetical protein